MESYPWGITGGIGLILLGTLGFIAYILLLDWLENKNAIKKRPEPKDHQ